MSTNRYDIKPIPTRYDGYSFRSRLEARWAVFFKTLGLPYRYEAEGYRVGGANYLADFYFPSCKCWNEAVDFLAITLLIRGCSSSASSLEIGLRSERRGNAPARRMRATPTTSFQHVHKRTTARSPFCLIFRKEVRSEALEFQRQRWDDLSTDEPDPPIWHFAAKTG